MGLTNHAQLISHHITPLVINALGGGHTDRQTHTYQHVNKNDFKKPDVDSLVAMLAWSNKKLKSVKQLPQFSLSLYCHIYS